MFRGRVGERRERPVERCMPEVFNSSGRMRSFSRVKTECRKKISFYAKTSEIRR